jgi:hypothetical protein
MYFGARRRRHRQEPRAVFRWKNIGASDAGWRSAVFSGVEENGGGSVGHQLRQAGLEVNKRPRVLFGGCGSKSDICRGIAFSE